jgi:hypothetical protein
MLSVFASSPFNNRVIVSAVFALLIYLIRALLIRFVFDRLAPGVQKERPKFLQSCWQLTYYVSVVAAACVMLHKEPFFPWNPEHYWEPSLFDFEFWSQRHVQLYTMWQTGFFLQALYTLLVADKDRHDYLQIVAHHFFALFLLFGAMGMAQKIGLSVLFLHDLSDITLYLAKISSYLDRAKVISSKWTSFWFGIFAVSFFYLKFYVYPVLMIWPSCVRFQQGVPGLSAVEHSYVFEAETMWEFSHLRICLGGHCLLSALFIIVFLIGINLLHVYWGYQLFKMVIRFAKGEKVQDTREKKTE